MNENEMQGIIDGLEDNLEEVEKENKKLKEEYSNLKDLKEAIDEHDRKIEERVLFDILSYLYFQDWTRACDYNKMTKEEIIQAYTNTCKEIEQRYNYNYSRDLLGETESQYEDF